jgi:hypothetical protein
MINIYGCNRVGIKPKMNLADMLQHYRLNKEKINNAAFLEKVQGKEQLFTEFVESVDNNCFLARSDDEMDRSRAFDDYLYAIRCGGMSKTQIEDRLAKAVSALTESEKQRYANCVK